jgi:signal transduction histidine kinase
MAALLAGTSLLSRRGRAVIASLGLLTASGILVHVFDGYIELHFHFFVMVALIALYQDWLPYLFAIGYVILHHGIVGVMDPRSVYNHPAAWEHPWRWAVIHGTFILAASIASVVHWRMNERAQTAVLREQAARAAAEAEVRLREDFLSTAAHELKTPLTTVKITAQLLSRRLEQPTPEVEKLSGLLHGQIGRLEELVSDLLDVSRIQQGRLQLQRERVDLAALAAEVVAQFEHAPERRPAHRLVVDTRGPVLGYWDRARLEQVLTNLISNALKYAPDGGTVRVEVRSKRARAALAVHDEGVGIDPIERDDLFQPFSRGASDSARAGGTGLGLYIARTVVEQHGGWISVDSTPGRGSSFSVSLPWGDPPAVAPPPTPALRVAVEPVAVAGAVQGGFTEPS